MLTGRDILWGVVLPAVVALVAAIAGQCGVGRDRRTQPWGPAAAIAAAFAVAYVGIAGGVPAFPPAVAQGWLFYFAALAVVVGILATIQMAFSSAPRPRPMLVGVLDFLAVFLLFLAPRLIFARAAALGPAKIRLGALAVFGGMFLWWLGMEALARRRHGVTLPLLLSAFAGSSALVLINARTQTLGQIAGAVAVALLVMTLLSLWYRQLSLAGGGILAINLIVLGLLLCGHLFADLTCREMLILAAAPLALWTGEIPPIARKPWLRFAVSAVLMLAILSAALVPALQGLKQTMDEQSQSSQY